VVGLRHGVGGAEAGIAVVVGRVVGVLPVLRGVDHRLRELGEQLPLEAESGLVGLLVLVAAGADVGREGRVRHDRQRAQRIDGHCFTWLAMPAISSCIWMALLAISKPRCASIMPTIASAMSTLEPSRYPCLRLVPVAARTAPLWAVVVKRLSPAGARPSGERTVTRRSL